MGSESLASVAAIGWNKYDMSRFKFKRLSSDKESCMKFGWSEKENRNVKKSEKLLIIYCFFPEHLFYAKQEDENN